MDIRPIRTRRDHDVALREIGRLMEMEPRRGTPEGDRLDVLTTLVEAWEAAHDVIDFPDPIAAIEEMMDQKGLTRRDLEDVIPRGRMSEVMNRKRPLSIQMIRDLHERLEIPAEVLIQSYPTTSSGTHTRERELA